MATIVHLKKHKDFYEFRLSNKPEFLFLCDLEDLDILYRLTWYVHASSKSTKTPYIRTSSYKEKKSLHFHREIMKAGNYTSEKVVDHISRDSLDCRKINLRVVNDSQNHQNTSRVRNEPSEIVIIDGRRVCLTRVYRKRADGTIKVSYQTYYRKKCISSKTDREEHIAKIKKFFNQGKENGQEKGSEA